MVCYCATGHPAARLSTPSAVHFPTKSSAIRSALLRQWNADLILVWHLALLPLVPLLRQPNARVAVALFGLEAWRELNPILQQLLRHSDLLIPISDYTWRRFAAANPSLADLPHTTAHLGLGEAAATEELGPPDDVPIALMISRLSDCERYKGHHEVIQCWPDVRAQLPEAQLWIVGDGGLRPHLERLAGYGVRFWGSVSERRKAEMIRQSRVLVMPSRNEGFGLVYLEAMRLGRPCLVSTLDAGQEVVASSAGLAIDPSDALALTEALVRLLTNEPAWTAWSQAARKRYEANYTAQAYKRRLVTALSGSGANEWGE
jgi:phosphatidylinositol alpha-1,6-mannosyltransferase